MSTIESQAAATEAPVTGSGSPQSIAARQRGYARPEDAGPMTDFEAAHQAGISAARIEQGPRVAIPPPLTAAERAEWASPATIALQRAELERKAQAAADQVRARGW